MTTLASAKKTPLSRDGVLAFAKQLDLAPARALLADALDTAGAHAAIVLAFALALRGEKLDPVVVRALAPEVDEVSHLGVLMRAADAPFVELAVAILGDDTISTTRSTYLVLLAADALGADEKAPEKLRTKARHLARHDLDVTPSVCLGAASLLLGDSDLSLLAAPFVKESKRNKRITDELVASSKQAPLEALPEVAAPRVTARMTVRKGAEPGRNDVCSCGSGQKYKKCCALKPKDAGSEEERVDASTLRKDQVMTLRPSEIARLEFDKLSASALLVAPRRAARVGKWAAVEQAIAAASNRKETADEVEELRFEALSHALDIGAIEPAERLIAALKEGRPETEEPVELALIKHDPNALAQLEAAMVRALEREGDGAHMIDIAYAMLRHLPALGILVARGAIHERRPNDSMELMEQIEDARDRLLLPPFEAWWDVFDFMMKGVKKPAAARKKNDGPDLKTELRRARAASRKASTEIDKLKKRLDEVDVQIAKAPKKKAGEPKLSAAAPVDAALTEERKRLKTKVEELQRIIGEGQEERRELKKQLAEAAEIQPDSRAPEEEPEEEEEDEEGEEAPRGILVPVFTDRAAKMLTELDGPAADVVLGMVAGLAAGRENAWFGVKRLEKARTVYSARAGIHYRVLFVLEEGTLRVHEIFHRRELEAAVNRVMKLSVPRS